MLLNIDDVKVATVTVVVAPTTVADIVATTRTDVGKLATVAAHTAAVYVAAVHVAAVQFAAYV